MKVTVADLGLGNLHSVVEALKRTGASVELSDDPAVVARAERLVVPGQGGFGVCAERLASGFGDALREWLQLQRPYLGICLGMQLLFEGSDEAEGEGLGYFNGWVEALAPKVGDVKIPHIGWKPLVSPEHAFIHDGGWFYFVHSYTCAPTDEEIVVGCANHGIDFCAAVARDHVFACQFHPEKSQHRGACLLQRFMES